MTLVNYPTRRKRHTHRPVNRRHSTPKVNIIESEDAFHIHLAIPGVAKDQVKIDVKEDQLIIDFHNAEVADKEPITYIRKEYDYTGFKKIFNLNDDINQSKIDAKLDHGVLTIILEKKEEAKAIPPKTITIK